MKTKRISKIKYPAQIMLVASFFLALLAILMPAKTALAAERTLMPDENGVLEIAFPTFIPVGDKWFIPPGTTLNFGPSGHFFIQGSLEIGSVGSDSGPATLAGIVDESNKVTITSSNPMASFQVKGGTFKASNVQFSGEKFISAFTRSHVTLSNSKVTSVNARGAISAIAIYLNSTLEVDSSIFNASVPEGYYNDPFLAIYTNANATITNSEISPMNYVNAISLYQNSRLYLESNYFSLCGYAMIVFGHSHAAGEGNAIACSMGQYDAFDDSTVTLKPKPKQCCSNIIFLPGFEGSRLYRKAFLENQLWEPNRNKDVEALFMDQSGESIVPNIYTKDVIRRFNVFYPFNLLFGKTSSPSYYADFVSYLKKLESDSLISGYSIFPYDWRYAPADAGIQALTGEIERQARLASNGKVTLIMHSYGGLIGKQALQEILLSNKKGLIDRVIYVAVPETGSPQALFSGLHGDRQVMAGGLLMNADTATKFAANLPSAHFLTPSNYFSRPISLEFINKKTKALSTYDATSSAPMQDDSGQSAYHPYSLLSIYSWLRDMIRQAEADIGNTSANSGQYVLPYVLPIIPSSQIAVRTLYAQAHLYDLGNPLEDTFETYSIVGLNRPTATGAIYGYKPCLRISGKIKSMPISETCLSNPELTKTIQYTNLGDGTVAFDGKNRRSGIEKFVSMVGLASKDKASIQHANILESETVQNEIRSILISTTTPANSEPIPYGSASGVGPNSSNPWIDMSKVYSLDIDGFVEGSVRNATTSFSIITLDQKERFQTIKIDSSTPSDIVPTKTGEGWSFAQMEPFGDISLRSLADQSISISFNQHTDSLYGYYMGSSSAPIPPGSGVQTITVESFENVPIGFGSILNTTMQYITPTPGHIATLDIDGDGMGDMNIEPTIGPNIPQPGGGGNGSYGNTGGSGGNSAGQGGSANPPSYEAKKSDALNRIHQAKIHISQLEIYSLVTMNTDLLSTIERQLNAGNPTFALIALKKKEARYAELSAWYADREYKLEHGLLTRFKSIAARNAYNAELAKTKAFLRDFARLKVILSQVQSDLISIILP